MLGFQSDEITVLRPNGSITLHCMRHSQIAYQSDQLLQKKIFDLMLSWESDEMTALWPNKR